MKFFLTFASKRPILTLALSIFPLMALLILCFLSLEDSLYSWDTRGYWVQFQNMGALFFQNPFQWLLENIAQTQASDYGPWIISLLLPFYALLGPTRFSFIWGSSLYLLILALLITSFASKFLAISREKRKKNYLLPYFLPLTFVPFWKPLLFGLPDLAGLMPIIGTLIFISREDLSGRFSLKKALILGVLLWLPFLSRRWYAYSVLSLYLSLPVLSWTLFTPLEEIKKIGLKKALLVVSHFAVAGLSSLILLFTFQFFLAINILSTNYSEVYAAYSSPLINSMVSIILGLGYLGFSLALASLFFSVKQKSKGRLYSLFFAFNFAFTFFLFTRTQGLGIQHVLPLCLWLLLLLMQGAYGVLETLSGKSFQIIFDCGLSAVSLLILLVSLFPLPSVLALNTPLLPAKSYPYQSNHFENYQNFSSFLEEKISPQNKVAILSSSAYLNVQTLASLTNERTNNSNLFVSQLDLRDHWDLNFLQARYLVLSEQEYAPVGKDNPSNVLSLPIKEIRSGQGIGKAYQKLSPNFELDGGVASIYERLRPFSEKELKAFVGKLIAIYPHWREFYDHSLVYAFLSSPKLDLGSGYARFYLSTGFGLSGEGDKVVALVEKEAIHWEIDSFPSDHLEIHVMSGFLGKVNKVIDRLIREGKNAKGLLPLIKEPINTTLGLILGKGKGVQLTIEDENGQREFFSLSGEESSRIDMRSFQGKRISLTLEGNSQSAQTVFIQF